MKSRKTLINVTVSSIYQIVTIICGLITPRLLLMAFGSTYYGAFSSVGQFLGIISALSMGIPGASRLELYKLLSISDNEGISKVVKATQKYSKKVSVIIIFYAALLCLLYPYISNSDLLFAENAIIIVIVALGLFIEYFFGMAYYNVIDADQKQYIRFALRIFATIANTLVVVLLIRLGYNVFTVKLASSMVFAITPFFVYLYVKNTYQIHRAGVPAGQRIFGGSIGSWLKQAQGWDGCPWCPGGRMTPPRSITGWISWNTRAPAIWCWRTALRA